MPFAISLGKEIAQWHATKPQDHNSLLLPVVLSEQIIPDSFTFALNYLVDHELDLQALDARSKNDEVGANAYDPRVMLKIVPHVRRMKFRQTASMKTQILSLKLRDAQRSLVGCRFFYSLVG